MILEATRTVGNMERDTQSRGSEAAAALGFDWGLIPDWQPGLELVDENAGGFRFLGVDADETTGQGMNVDLGAYNAQLGYR